MIQLRKPWPRDLLRDNFRLTERMFWTDISKVLQVDNAGKISAFAIFRRCSSPWMRFTLATASHHTLTLPMLYKWHVGKTATRSTQCRGLSLVLKDRKRE